MANEPTYAFIDSQNVNLAIREQGWTLDWSRFRKYLELKHNVTKAFLFLGFIPENQDLYTNLQKDGFVLIFKPTLQYKDGTTKGNVDAELVLQAMLELPNYQQAMIVTGDGDFYCLINYLNENEKLKYLLIPNQKKYSALLKKVAPGKILFMDNLKGKLEYKRKKSPEKVEEDKKREGPA